MSAVALVDNSSCSDRCLTCPFRGTLGGKVPFSGARDSPWVLIGEAPGREEVRAGKPFSGPNGKLLWQFLSGGNREELLVTNAISCLPKNDKKPAELIAATRACRAEVIDLIQEYPRSLIIALGNAAVWSTTGNFGLKITQIRGRLIPSPLASQGILPIIHPAAILRGTGNARQFKEDLQYAASLIGIKSSETLHQSRLANSGVAKEPRAFVRSGYKEAKVDEDLDIRTFEGQEVVVDIETSGFHAGYDRILCVGVSRVDDPLRVKVLLPDQLEEAWKYLKNAKCIYHNGKFDIGFLRAAGIPARVDGDTMLLSYALDENGGVHDLEQLMGDLLGAPDYKNMLDPYKKNKNTSYAEIPAEVLHRYMALDVGGTSQIYPILRARVAADPALEKLYTKVLIPASEMLCRAERKGIYVDQEHLAHMSEILKAELIKEGERLNELVGYKINPNSSQQVAVLLYDKLKLKPSGRQMGRSTDKNVLARMPPHPVIKALQAYRAASKMNSTYVEGTLKALAHSGDGRVHASFLIHATRTGRLSSRNPNLQNVPRRADIRNIYAAPPGRRFVEVDLNQAELRSLAALSGDEFLCEVYNRGERSLHEEVAEEFFGPDFTSEQKMRAKAVNFGIVYGREAGSIAEEFRISRAEAQRYIDKWFERAPKAYEFIKRCRNAALNGETITTVFGRKKRHSIVTRENLHELQNEAANFPHQSIASDITLVAGCQMQNEVEALDSFLLVPVHDSILIETPDDDDIANRVITIAKGYMEEVPKQWGITRVPFKAEHKTGYQWGSLK